MGLQLTPANPTWMIFYSGRFFFFLFFFRWQISRGSGRKSRVICVRPRCKLTRKSCSFDSDTWRGAEPAPPRLSLSALKKADPPHPRHPSHPTATRDVIPCNMCMWTFPTLIRGWSIALLQPPDEKRKENTIKVNDGDGNQVNFASVISALGILTMLSARKQ